MLPNSPALVVASVAAIALGGAVLSTSRAQPAGTQVPLSVAASLRGGACQDWKLDSCGNVGACPGRQYYRGLKPNESSEAYGPAGIKLDCGVAGACSNVPTRINQPNKDCSNDS